MGSSKAPPDEPTWAVFERRGWSQSKAAEADTLEELIEKLAEKTGQDI